MSITIEDGPPCDDGTVSHEYAGHAPGSYEASATAFTYAAIGFLAGVVAVIVVAWVTS